jgi:hypothetical protein
METCGFADAALPQGEGHCVWIGRMPWVTITSGGSGGKAGHCQLLDGWQGTQALSQHWALGAAASIES